MTAPAGDCEAFRQELARILGCDKRDLPRCFERHTMAIGPQVADHILERWPNADPGRVREFMARFLISRVHLKRVVYGHSLHTIDGHNIRPISFEEREAAKTLLHHTPDMLLGWPIKHESSQQAVA